MDENTLQLIHDVVFSTTTAVLQPFLGFIQTNSQLYWPFLLSALALAILTVLLLRGGSLAGRAREAGLSWRVWWHPSARADYRFFVVNGILFPLIFGPVVLSGAWFAGRVEAGLGTLFGAPQLAGGLWIDLAYSVVFFLVYDFGRYLGHWIQHRVDALWLFHKVHHSAEVLTPFTNARAHPVDLLCMWIFAYLLTGGVTGLFAWAFAGSAGLITYFGLHAAILAYNIVGNLRHSHVWLSYGPWLSRILISPAQHQVHHSTEARHVGHNIGFALAFWDRLFGTLYVPRGHERFAIGLGDGTDACYHGVWRMYWLPFAELFGRDRAETPAREQAGLTAPERP